MIVKPDKYNIGVKCHTKVIMGKDSKPDKYKIGVKCHITFIFCQDRQPCKSGNIMPLQSHNGSW